MLMSKISTGLGFPYCKVPTSLGQRFIEAESKKFGFIHGELKTQSSSRTDSPCVCGELSFLQILVLPLKSCTDAPNCVWGDVSNESSPNS